MSNPITYSINRMIKQDIPKGILEMAFLSRYGENFITVDTLESKIRQEIVDERVAEDLELVHSTQLTIPLARCQRLAGGYYNATYYVPNELTQGKKITSVLHLVEGTTPIGSDQSASFSPLTNQGGTTTTTSSSYSSSSSSSSSTGNGFWPTGFVTSGTTNTSSISSSGSFVSTMQQAVQSVSPIKNVANALCYLIGHNTIFIRDTIVVPQTMYFRVNVENDENLNHIQRPFYTVIHKLIVLATKAYIYNRLILEQDNAFINSGGELNVFRDIVNSYESANEQYEEYLEEAYKSMLLNDHEQARRHYQARTGGGW